MFSGSLLLVAQKDSVFCLVRSEAQKLKKFSGQLTKSLLKGSTIRLDFGRVGASCRKRPEKPKIYPWPRQAN